MLILISESTCLAGIKSGEISNSQMTASSNYGGSYAPEYARLDVNRGWIPQESHRGTINSFRRHIRKQSYKVVAIPPKKSLPSQENIDIDWKRVIQKAVFE